MDLSNYLAQIWGISITVSVLALLIRGGHLRRVFKSVENEECLFCWGITSFVIGIAMVLTHNVWVQSWQVVITVLGWIALLKGLSILFLPQATKNLAKKMENKEWLPVVLVIGVFVGLVITYLGFTGK